MINLNKYEVWFVTGNQHLYGEETIRQVEIHSKEIARELDNSEVIPVKVVFMKVLLPRLYRPLRCFQGTVHVFYPY